MSNVPCVSVMCLTYNHGKYIRKALDGFVMQKTTFPFEVIIHDDCSTDNTVDIIEEYVKKYPELITLITEKHNQFSLGKSTVVSDMITDMSRGKYIALCEGDDYWTDEYKLELQYQAMENSECDICACAASVVSEDGNVEIREIRPACKNTILPVQEVIYGGGQYVATASLFARSEIIKQRTYDFEKVIMFDYVTQIKGALKAGMLYLDKKMAVYRAASIGSWTLRMQDEKKHKEHNEKEWRMLRTLDRETRYKYHEYIEARINNHKNEQKPFYVQLKEHETELSEALSACKNKKLYMWGKGLRGTAFEKWCRDNDIKLKGVCDKRNVGLGEIDEFGFSICNTEIALRDADVILTSNNWIYMELKKNNVDVFLVDLQKYMPWG